MTYSDFKFFYNDVILGFYNELKEIDYVSPDDLKLLDEYNENKFNSPTISNQLNDLSDLDEGFYIFYKEYNLEFIILKDTKRLMQSIELTYAILMYFKDNNILIDEFNYSKLFQSNQRFLSQFKISKDELLSLYPYLEKEKKL